MPEDEEITPSPEYMKKFNDGYIMAKHAPDIAEKLRSSVKDLKDGFEDGMKQFDREKQKSLYPDWLREDAFSDQDKDLDQDKELDKDDLDRE